MIAMQTLKIIIIFNVLISEKRLFDVSLMSRWWFCDETLT